VHLRRTLLEICLLLLFIYTPGVNEAFGTDKKEPVAFIVFAAITGVVLMAWGEFRKFIIRRNPVSTFTSLFGW
jgi:hypothetical protein